MVKATTFFSDFKINGDVCQKHIFSVFSLKKFEESLKKFAKNIKNALYYRLFSHFGRQKVS